MPNASLLVILSARPGACTDTAGKGKTAESKERTRAPRRPKERVQQGGERSGNEVALHIALFSARTDKKSESPDKARTHGGPECKRRERGGWKRPAHCFAPCALRQKGQG